VILSVIYVAATANICGCNRRQLVPEEVRLTNGHSFNGYATDAELLAAFDMNPSAVKKEIKSGETRTDTTYKTDRQTILVVRRVGHPGFYLRSSGAIATELFFIPADEISTPRP